MGWVKYLLATAVGLGAAAGLLIAQSMIGGPVWAWLSVAALVALYLVLLSPPMGEEQPGHRGPTWLRRK